MNELKFPKLVADQIECRVGQTSEKGFSLLLYKTARVDADILDQVVGQFNWQKRYYEVRGLVICSIGIYFADRKEWVWKDDTGSAGSIEEEKSICSDAQKRSAFCWGIGRELYSSPFIWVSKDTGFTQRDRFDVKEIAYDQNGKISKLLIVETKTGGVAYSYGCKEKVAQTSQKAPKIANGGITAEQKKQIADYLATLPQERLDKVVNFLKKQFNVNDYEKLTKKQANDFIGLWRK